LNRTRCLFAAILIVPCFCLADDARTKSDATELINRAATRQGIRSAGEKPYILRVKFRAEHIVPKPMEGQYEEVWMSPDKWRRELVLSGYKQVEIGGFGSKWLSRNLEFNPMPSYLLETALDAFTELKMPTVEKVISIQTKKNKRSELRCIEFAAEHASPKRGLCFNDSGVLVSEEYLQQKFEYENFGTYGDKTFPRTIRIYADDRKVLELGLEDLVPPTNIAPELFRAAADARQLAPCGRWPAVPTQKVQPQYPREARDAHEQGTVTVYAAVAADGHIERTQILQSAGQALDKATQDAVQQWAYPAITCGVQPLPTEIEVRVNYSLSH